jgi:hypothetical protein
MKRLYIIIVTISIFSVFFVSCYYDNEEALYPSLNSVCDTTNVTFSGPIVTIFNNSCYSCHSNNTAAAAGNNIRLENYADVKAMAVRVAGSINHTGSFSPMPKNGGMIKTCSIAQFDIWVRNGMLNN